jgi:predicted DCC family thiol-disulfide oxidoreductase YuxK
MVKRISDRKHRSGLWTAWAGAWSLFATLARLVPASLRDALYNVIARNRLRWFGAREQCYLPEPSRADRFLS